MNEISKNCELLGKWVHVLELKSHGGFREEGASIQIDLTGKSVNVKGLGTGTVENAEHIGAVGSSEALSVLAMRLIDLKCYRMPGMSSIVTSSESKAPGT